MDFFLCIQTLTIPFDGLASSTTVRQCALSEYWITISRIVKPVLIHKRLISQPASEIIIVLSEWPTCTIAANGQWAECCYSTWTYSSDAGKFLWCKCILTNDADSNSNARCSILCAINFSGVIRAKNSNCLLNKISRPKREDCAVRVCVSGLEERTVNRTNATKYN